MAEAKTSLLDRTLIEYAWFLADLSAYAKQHGVPDPVDHIQKVAALKPDWLSETAERYDKVANFYAKLETSMNKRLADLDDAWKSDAAEDFRDYFDALRTYVSGDERSLYDLASGTAQQMRDVSDVIVKWQNALAKLIREQAKEWEGALDEIYAAAADAFSIDPLSMIANTVRAVLVAATRINRSYEASVTGDAESEARDASFVPLNAERLRGRVFEWQLSDIPGELE